MLVTFSAIPRTPCSCGRRISDIFAVAFRAIAVLSALPGWWYSHRIVSVLQTSPEFPVFPDLPCLTHRFGSWSQPTQEKEMMATKTAPVRKKNPVEHTLKLAPYADAAEVDRSAIRTPCGEHQLASSSLGDWKGPWRIKRDERSCGRLASRAALICSDVRRSGSESCIRSLPRNTWRLCRFATLLSIHSLALQEAFAILTPFLAGDGIRGGLPASNRRRSTSFFPILSSTGSTL